MSSIKQKGAKIHERGAHFEPLNKRKGRGTVGETYGERRENISRPAETSTSWIQSLKDRFTGKKRNKIEAFRHSGDRFEKSDEGNSPQSIVRRSRMVEQGLNLHSRLQYPTSNKYLHFLEGVITLYNPAKAPKKS